MAIVKLAGGTPAATRSVDRRLGMGVALTAATDLRMNRQPHTSPIVQQQY
jgi:hypothetical protein